jgi:methionine-S-sulfoxide reductase
MARRVRRGLRTQPLPLLVVLLAVAPVTMVEAQLSVDSMLLALAGGSAPAPPPTSLQTDGRAPAVSGVASFGLGCFWGGQISFRCAEDIVSTTVVGYMGGVPASPAYVPAYADYSEHGYTETVELVYDAAQSERAYTRLLEIFWASHNPTSAVEGSAYSSVIFAHTEQQEQLARRSIAERNQELAASDFCRDRCGELPIVPCYVDGCAIFTTIRTASGVAFWPAEDYHQHWYTKLGETCASEGFLGPPWLLDQEPGSPVGAGH